MKYFKLTLISLIAATFALTACGGGGDSGGKGGDGTQPMTDVESITIDGVTFKMMLVPGGLKFKTRTGDLESDSASLNTITNPYWIGETEVTYELWEKVYEWATNGDQGTGAGLYEFANSGQMGSDGEVSGMTDQHPVTKINWRDAIVWCNALTEWYNAEKDTDLDLVYYTDEHYELPLRKATNEGFDSSIKKPDDIQKGTQDRPYIKAATDGNTDMDSCTAKGFRLPTMAEWSAAARYEGNRKRAGAYEYPEGSGVWWTPGDHASGATANYDNEKETKRVAVYDKSTTAAVKTKAPNALGLYDMSGNVQEWTFNWFCDAPWLERMPRGGSYWAENSYEVQIGLWGTSQPYGTWGRLGFRFAKNE